MAYTASWRRVLIGQRQETVLAYCRQSYHRTCQQFDPAQTGSTDPTIADRSRHTSLLQGELRVIKGLIRDHQVILDVGANQGDWSIALLNTHPHSDLHLFEPLPDPYRRLLARLSTDLPHRSITPNRLAVSSRSQARTFYDYGDDRSTLSTFHRRVQAEQQFQIPPPKEITVRTISLDEYCQDLDLKRIHFLKIDVEGGEKEVLLGAKDLLGSGQIDYIQFEYGGTYLDAGISLEEVYAYLVSYRYHLFKILPNGLEYLPQFSSQYEIYDYSNYLAVHERLVDLILQTPKSMLDLPRLVQQHEITPKGVIHIGAHEGRELETYQAMGIQNIVLIEANPEVYERLRANVAHVPGVTVINCGITNQDGTATLHVTSADQSSSLLPLKRHQQIYPGIKEIRQITVTAKTLDSLLQDYCLDPSQYTLLNIDIQGAELLALQGAVNCLRFIEGINVEVNYEELYVGCAQVEDLDRFLLEHGFRRVATKCPYHSAWGDAFYTKIPQITMSLLGQYGRFGNQLFQYMFLRLYAKRYELRYGTPPWVGQHLFQITDPEITARYPLIYDWSNILSDSILEKYGQPSQSIDICGYFQYHTRYYRDQADFIRSLFTPTDPIKAALDVAIEQLRQGGRTVIGLHLRRGDFGFQYFFVAPSQWYLTWLEGLWQTLDQPVLYIASDDIDAVKADFKDYDPVTANDLDIDLPVLRLFEFYIDFYILSQCDLLAISNSTFSFFAALLNQTGWAFFRPELSTQKLIPFCPWHAEPLLRHASVSSDEDHNTQIQTHSGPHQKRLKLLALPDWQAAPEILYEQLTDLITQLLQFPHPRTVTLILPVFDRPPDQELPDPETLVNDVILMMMLEDPSLQETGDLPILSILKDIAPVLWDVVLSAVRYRMPLERETAIPTRLQDKISALPLWPGVEGLEPFSGD